MGRVPLLAMIAFVLAGWTSPPGHIVRIADDANATARTGAEDVPGKNMQIARSYIGTRNYTGAINRLKIVMTQFQSSPYVEEALARLCETYLALSETHPASHIVQEAQTAAAVLVRKFPEGRWTAQARDALKSAGLEPMENERSWISRAFQ